MKVMYFILPEEECAEGSLERRISSGRFHFTGVFEDQKDIGEDDKYFLILEKTQNKRYHYIGCGPRVIE